MSDFNDRYLEKIQAAGGVTEKIPDAVPVGGGDADAQNRYLQKVAVTGRPEWNDPRIPAAARVDDYLRVHARAGTPWEAAAPGLQRMGVADAEPLRQQFDLERKRVEYSGKEEHQLDTMGYVGRRSIPFVSAGFNWYETREYGKALERFNAGKASADDIDLLAKVERIQTIDKKRNTEESVVSELARVPAMLGEGYVAGKLVGAVPRLAGPGALPAAGRLGVQTTAMPSMYLQQGAQRQLENPQDNIVQSYGPAWTLGAVQTAVLGRLGQKGGNLLGRTGEGMAEMQGADTAASGIDDVVKHVTGKSLGLNTNYGVLGGALRNDPESGKQIVVQTATFGVFAKLHGRDPQEVIDTTRKALDAGPDRRATAKSVAAGGNVLADYMKANPNATRAEAREAFDRLPDGPVKDHAKGLADAVLPEKAPAVGPETPDPHQSPAEPGQNGTGSVIPPPESKAKTEIISNLPLDSLTDAEVKDLAASLGWSAKKLRQKQGEPWVAKIVAEMKRPPAAAPESRAGASEPPASESPASTPERAPTATPEAKVGAMGRPAPPRPISPAAADRLGELRRRQAERGPMPNPMRTAAPVSPLGRRPVPTEAPAPRPIELPEAREKLARGMDSDVLTAREKHILHERLVNERSLEDVASDSPMAKRDGTELTRERIRQIENEGLKKLGIEGKSINDMLVEETAARAEAQIARAEEFTGGGQRQKGLVNRGKMEGFLKPREVERTREKLTHAEKMAAEDHERAVEAFLENRDHDAREHGQQGLLEPDAERQAEAAPRKGEGVEGSPRPDQGGAGEVRSDVSEPAAHKPGLGAAAWREQQRQRKLEREAAAARVKAEAERAKAEKAAERARDQAIREEEEAQKLPKELRPPARMPREGDWAYEERQRRVAGAQTIGDYLRGYGGIDPDSLKPAERQELKENGLGALLTNDEGRRGSNAIDVLAEHLIREGYMPERSDLNASDNLLEEARNHRLVSGEEHWAALEHGRREWQERQERFADMTPAEAAAAKLLEEKWVPADDEPVPSFAANTMTPPGGPAKPGVREAAVRWVQGIRDFVSNLGGQTAPKTSRVNAAAGDAIGRVAGQKVYAEELADHLIDKVLGADQRPLTRVIAGAVWQEMRLRHTKALFERQSREASAAAAKARALGDTEAAQNYAQIATEKMNAANKVQTLVGGKASAILTNPLASEHDYQHWLHDPEINAILNRLSKHFVPVNEGILRKELGLDDTDPINSHTQIPGLEMSSKAIQEGEETPTTVMIGGSRGRLGSQKIPRSGATNEFTGANAHGYETDIAEIMRHNLRKRIPAAAKAELYRTLTAAGLGEWHKPGDKVNTEGWQRMPDVNPALGTQAAKRGQTTFWVHPDAYDEVHRVLGINKPPERATFALASTWAALVSTVEATAHSKNLLSMLTRPGMNPLDVIRSMKGLLYKDPDVMGRVVELARIGSMREHMADTGSIANLVPDKWGQTDYRPEGYRGLVRKIDPTHYMGKFLTILDRSMRLTADKAFDRLADRGWVENTEQNKRDFVNQLGNYSKLTQNRGVAWLRDTGLGPFATASTNFWVQGLKGLTLRHGLRATDARSDLKLRAEMFLRMATMPVLAATLNYLLWKRADGDDNTPLGSLKLGTTENGKTSHLDLTALTGLSRGAREVGLLALAEGQRPGAKKAGATLKTSTGQGIKDIVVGALHPAVGPAVNFGYVLLIGKTLYGTQEATPVTPQQIKAGESQQWNNLAAAFWDMNPVLHDWLKTEVEAPRPKAKLRPLGEKIGRLLGPFGPKLSGGAPGRPR